MHAHARTLATLLALAALLTPAAPAVAAGGTLPVGTGDVVTIDLSRVPSRTELRGTAICAGSRLTLTGAQEPLACERPFTFDGPVAAGPLVLTFRPKDGSAPTRVEFPVARDPRPRTFTAPSAGTVTVGALPAPASATSAAGAAPSAGAGAPAAGAKAAPPPEVLERARAAAATACAACQDATSTLRDFEIAAAPPSTLEVSVTVVPAPRAR